MDDDKKESTVDKPIGTTGSALGGAVAGAVAGTALGVPVVGTVIGALSGAAIGAARKRSTSPKRKAKPAAVSPKKKQSPKKAKKTAAAKMPSKKHQSERLRAPPQEQKSRSVRQPRNRCGRPEVLRLDHVQKHLKRKRSECEKTRSLRGYITRSTLSRAPC